MKNVNYPNFIVAFTFKFQPLIFKNTLMNKKWSTVNLIDVEYTWVL